jgi:hypothetical protein
MGKCSSEDGVSEPLPIQRFRSVLDRAQGTLSQPWAVHLASSPPGEYVGPKSLKKEWVVKRKTAKDRFNRSVGEINKTCRKSRHEKVDAQHRRLVLKMRGHYAYYGITGNSEALSRFYLAVCRGWQKWLTSLGHLIEEKNGERDRQRKG